MYASCFLKELLRIPFRDDTLARSLVFGKVGVSVRLVAPLMDGYFLRIRYKICTKFAPQILLIPSQNQHKRD